MFALLTLLPILAAVTSFLLYKHTGKKELLRFDLVQFIYAFVLCPLIFVWMKSFILFFAKNEVNPNLSTNELFLIDTTFSVLFLFFFAFVVIHSLTKSFEVKRYQDPLYNLLTHVESFHLWISHSVMYSLGLLFLTLFSAINVFSPILVTMSKILFYCLLAAGSFSGLLAFAAIWLSNFTEYRFMKLMKLVFAAMFTTHVLLYFFFEPGFNAQFSVYWFVFSLNGAMVAASFFVEKSNRSQRFLERFHHKKGWRKNNFLTLLEQHR